MDVPDQSQAPAQRSCPDCGAAVQQGQRRCTNCGASVDARRRLPRRTPLIAAVSVLGLAGIGVVVAQAAVTEQAGIDAAAPADVASAPVTVAGNPLPGPTGPTSTPPKVDEPADTGVAGTTPTLDIPSVDSDTLGTTPTDTDTNSKDGKPTDEDKPADPNDLQDEKKIKVVNARNYDPMQRAGVEFGKPKATIDKRSRTVWDVNVPADGQPFNVGITLDLGDEAKKVSELKIGTPTPKFGAVIYRADTEEIPETVDDKEWKLVKTIESVSDDLSVPMSEDGDTKWARYILVYLTTPISPDDTRAAISNLEVLP